MESPSPSLPAAAEIARRAMPTRPQPYQPRQHQPSTHAMAVTVACLHHLHLITIAWYRLDYIYICICTYVCIYWCMYICTCIYIYTGMWVLLLFYKGNYIYIYVHIWYAYVCVVFLKDLSYGQIITSTAICLPACICVSISIYVCLSVCLSVSVSLFISSHLISSHLTSSHFNQRVSPADKVVNLCNLI